MAAALALMVGLDRLVGGVSLTVPALFGGGADFVFVRTYLPLIWAAAIADSFAGRCLSVEARPLPFVSVPVSRLGIYDATLFLVASSTVALVSVAPSGEWSEVGPVLVLSGVTCIGTLRAGPAVGIFTSTMLMLLTSVYPQVAPGSRFIHVLQPDGEVAWSLGCGIAVGVAAVALLATNSARTRLRVAEASGL